MKRAPDPSRRPSPAHAQTAEGAHTVPLELRLAGHADVEAIVALVESAYRGPSSRTGWTTEADLLDGQRTDVGAVAGLLDNEDGDVLLAERAGELVGCCQLERDTPSGAYFGMFAVRPDRQGAGIGRWLLGEAERRAREHHGCAAVRMTVLRQRAELIAWYGRRGYRPTGERVPFPDGDERFGIPRRADLEFVVLAKRISERADPVE